MPVYPVPHTPEWFDALRAFNPQQAAMTEQVLKMAGSNDVCSVCGDDPATDQKLTNATLPAGAVGTIRLCDDCLNIRTKAGESFTPL